MALRVEADRGLATAARQADLRRILGRQRLRAQRAHRRKIWSSYIGSKVNTSLAYDDGRLFAADYTGTLHALDARSGRKLWSAGDATEFYYATPAVAYGRVFIGSTDGTMYAYGARTGNLLWAKSLGTYVYSSAALFDKKVYAGSYDGKFFALVGGNRRRRLAEEMPARSTLRRW